MDEEGMQDLIETVEKLERDESIRAVVTNGSGKSSISGANIRKMAHTSPKGYGWVF